MTKKLLVYFFDETVKSKLSGPKKKAGGRDISCYSEGDSHYSENSAECPVGLGLCESLRWTTILSVLLLGVSCTDLELYIRCFSQLKEI